MAQGKASAGDAEKAKAQKAPPAAAMDWPGEWPEQLPSGLWPRLLLAQAHGGSISKSGRNEHHSYDYVRAEDVIRDASKILSRAGLVATVDEWEITLTEGSTKGGGRSVECKAESTLWIINPEDPTEKVGFPIIGTGTDSPGDKAIYKAQTGGKKYAWQDALTLAFGDDPEDTSSPGAIAAAEQQVRGSSGPAYGAPYTDLPRARAAIAYLLGGQDAVDDDAILQRADRLIETLQQDAGGYLPSIVARGLLHTAADLKAAIEQGVGDPASGPDAPQAEADEAQAAAEEPDADPEANEPEASETDPDPNQTPSSEGGDESIPF